ncbi:cell division protein ZapE [bacterium]|nr:cell division protein ZapE [bacterium]
MAYRKLHDAYNQWLDTGRIQPDAGQYAVVNRLSQLQDELDGYAPPSRIKESILKLLPVAPAPAPRGVYIHGDVGRGKSMLMDLFFETAPVEKKRRQHFHQFMREVHRTIHEWRTKHGGEEDADPILPLARQIRDSTSLLCLDELEVHDITDAMMLARLFTLLLKRGVVMVFTSNRAPHALYPNGLQRDRFLKFIDALVEKIDVVHLDSPLDYRLGKLKAMQRTYVHPLGTAADQFMEQAFASLTNQAKPEPAVLEVNGRQVTLPRCHHSVAWCDFDDLCAQPLASHDYLQLAGQFDTLLLSNIPALKPEQRNEARRFIMLIDALYDQRVKLVATAETAPEGIYSGHSGQFEFHRTVSRLMDMQTEAYLGEPHKRPQPASNADDAAA